MVQADRAGTTVIGARLPPESRLSSPWHPGLESDNADIAGEAPVAAPPLGLLVRA